MTLGIMQPYFFPYFGYIQLIYAADTFIIYDDVNFIKGGWINRNRIVINGVPHFFTVPLEQSSSFKKISDIEINEDKYDRFKTKFLKTIRQTYIKANNFGDFYPKLEEFFNRPFVSSISELSTETLTFVFDYLGKKVNIIYNKDILKQTAHLGGEERILDICRKLNASKYINLSGGVDLYNKTTFDSHGIELKFLSMDELKYSQGSNSFLPNLSIIDILMHNDKLSVIEYLKNYSLS
ncbi:WbqC family protein [Winogradskyella maritima]|uniref:WbqC family protein n=1 Tax=Winogradskyella maritima TaxID=1517766 RepID=A0ABV8AGS5_9FLAO|nr:WbqC family protein [Winogradskyella maritima]